MPGTHYTERKNKHGLSCDTTQGKGRTSQERKTELSCSWTSLSSVGLVMLVTPLPTVHSRGVHVVSDLGVNDRAYMSFHLQRAREGSFLLGIEGTGTGGTDFKNKHWL